MGTAKRLIYVLVMLLIILGFQNCGVQSPLNQSRSFSSFEQSGNGGGYEGKPDGTYYHYIPSYTCEGKPSAEQITEIKDGQAYLYQNKNNQCADQSAPIEIAEIDISPFQNEFISVKDALFKRYDEKPLGIPANIAEILCRDDFTHPKFEVVAHYDRDKNVALARIYLPESQVADFSVSRILSSNEVQYVSEEVALRVDLSKAAMATRKFAGTIEKSTLAGVKAGPVVCVIGGSIDNSKWALKELTQVDAGSFQLLKNNEIMFFSEVSRTYFSATLFNTVSHLFKITVDNIVSDFSKFILGDQYNIIYRVGPVDDNLSVFFAKLPSEMWPSMYVYDSRTSKTKKLTNLGTSGESEAYYLKTPVLTEDQHLFYDTQIIQGTSKNTVVLRVYDFKTDSIREIRKLNETSNGFLALPKTNKFLLFWKNRNSVNNVVEIYDAKTATSRDLTLQIPSACLLVAYGARPILNETALLVSETCNSEAAKVVQVSLIDGSVKVIGDGQEISWISNDTNWVLLVDKQGLNTVYDVNTGQLKKVPVDPRFGFSGSDGITNFALSEFDSKIALVGNRYLFGFGGPIDSASMYQVDLTTGLTNSVCDKALGKKLFLGSLPNGKVFLFTYDSKLKVYRFYQVKSVTDCQRLNEFPSDFPNVPKLISTNIGFGLLLGNPLSASSLAWTREAVFVPIDGRPPLKFNSNTNSNWEMEVSADKNRIVLRGPGADGRLKIMSFDL